MQIIELAAKLQSVGLTDKQARVYVAALFLGSASAQKIAQQSEVNRATTYVILDELAEMGLVSQSTEGKKTVFVAEPPEALERYLEGQKSSIETKKSELKSLMPQLKQQEHGESSDAPVVRFYRGIEGINSTAADSRRKARVGSTVYAMSNYDEVVRFAPDIFSTSPKARLKKKIASRLMYSYHDLIPTDKAILRETLRLGDEVKADVSLYEDRAHLVSYGSDGTPPTGIVIESKEIVGVLRQLFEMAWDSNSKK
jgi:sugar-specific transcriptional regulator TrmB